MFMDFHVLFSYFGDKLLNIVSSFYSIAYGC